jgi:hypothetical protein
MKYTKNTCILLVAFFYLSCSQPLDFSQLGGYKTEASFTAALVYFELSANEFFGTSKISEKSNFKVFKTDFMRENLTKIDFEFVVKNEFFTDFTIEIILLDADDNFIYKLENIEVAANDLECLYQESIAISKNQDVKNFNRIEVIVSIVGSAAEIAPEDLSTLEFDSGITLYIAASL